MLLFRKLLCLLFAALLLVQPVFAETESATEAAQLQEADIISAVHTMAELPHNWNPLNPATEEKQWLIRQTTAPMYQLTEDGSWMCVLTRALPEDVTADYAGSYGIPAGATGGYAYRILLSTDARWEDGLKITADDYVFSIQKLLIDEENRENWTFLANAEAVLSEKKKPGDEIISLRDAAFSTVLDAMSAGHRDFYVDTSHFWGLDSGWVSIADRSRIQDFAMPDGMEERFVSGAYLYNRYLASGRENSRFQSEFIGISKTYEGTTTMEDLGVLKISPFELVLILDKPLAPSTLMQKLEKLFLFRKNFWGKDFATSAQTYCSYGPYRITSADSAQIVLEPNENWWGTPVTDAYDRLICRGAGKD